MEKTYVLFDLDGTLTDSGPGIVNGFKYAIARMGREEPPLEVIKKFVGPPLKESFGTVLGYSAEDTDKAIAFYRAYYNGMGGVLENELYPGVREMLEELKAAGKTLIIATSKGVNGTRVVLDHFDLRKYFDFVATANDKDRVTKADVIRYVIRECGITDLGSAIMVVGDRRYDMEAAAEVGMDSMGMTYGGYGTEEELRTAGATYLANTPEDAVKQILGL